MAEYRYPEGGPPPLLVAEAEAVGAYDAKTHLPKLLADVATGKSYVITKHGRPIARLVPVEPQADASQIIEALRSFRRGKELGDVAIRELIEEGRS